MSYKITNLDIFEQTIIKLLQTEPFYGNLLTQFNKIFTNNIPTLAVAPPCKEYSETQISLLINLDFFNSFPLEQRVDMLKHECLHVMNKHFIRCEFDNKDKTFLIIID